MKPRTLLLLGVGTMAVCNLLMPFIPSYAMIPVWTLNGFAQAMLWPPIVRILADSLDSESFVRANLIVTSAAHIATILLYLYVPVCLSFMIWQAVFITAAILAAVGFLIVLIALGAVLRGATVRTERRAEAQKAKGGMKEYFALILSAGIIPIFFSIIMMGFLRDGIETWLPTLYSEAFGRDASESILVSVLLPIFSILSISVITSLHKTPLFNNEAKGTLVLFGIASALSVPLLLLINVDSAMTSIICLVLVALISSLMHASNFLLISCMPGRFASFGKAATTSGFANACTYVGAAISMYGIPFFAEGFGWVGAVVSWLVVAILGALSSLLSCRAYTGFIGRAEGK